MDIRPLDWQETIPIRHQVLWPHKHPEYTIVKGDADAQHYGIFVDDNLVCVASLYIAGSTARLRKFACLADFQGQGIGSHMLQYLVQTLKAQKITYFWFDARETAIGFYTRFGFEVEGDRFYKSEVAYFKMGLLL